MKSNAFCPNRSEMVASLKERKFLAFTTMGASFVIDIVSVKNVLPYQEPISYPQLGVIFSGVMSVATSCIPLVEMRAQLAGGTPASHGLPEVIVVEIRGFSIGLVVDKVEGLVTLTPEQTRPLVVPGRRTQSPFVTNIVGQSTPLALLQIPESLQFASQL